MAEQSTVERAIELAKTGTFKEVRQIIRQLRLEGYLTAPSHLAGKSIRRQISRLIKAAVSSPESSSLPDPPPRA